jgi:hypothetical protein
MSEEEKPKSNIHINLGGLVIIIIIVLILFKVDIKSKINSPQFQKNIAYIENFFVNLYEKNIKGFYEKEVKNLSNNLVNTGIEGVQDTVNKKLDGMKKE